MDWSLESSAGGRGIESCSRQIIFSLIIESKLSNLFSRNALFEAQGVDSFFEVLIIF